MKLSGLDFGRAFNSHFNPSARWDPRGRRLRVSGVAPSARARQAPADETMTEVETEAVNGMFGVGFDFDLSSVTEPLAKLVSPIVKAAAPILKPLEKAYNAIPMPLKAVLAPQTLVTEYAYAHPEQIPLFGKFATAAKAVYEKAQAQGHPNPVAVAAQVVHPAMLHPPVAAAVAKSPPATKLKLALNLPRVPIPAAVTPHLAAASPFKPQVDRHVVYAPAGMRV